MSLRYEFFEQESKEPEEMYFRYYIRFGDTWETGQGGKLPGFGGTYGIAGWGGRKSNGTASDRRCRVWSHQRHLLSNPFKVRSG